MKIRNRKILAAGMLAAVLLFVKNDFAQAADRNMISNDSQVNVWKSEGSALEYDVKQEGEIRLSIDGSKQKEDYEVCVLNIGSDGIHDYSSVDAFAMTYHYTGDKEVLIQPAFSDIAGNKTKVREEMQYVLEEKGRFAVYHTVKGYITLKPGAEGTLYLLRNQMDTAGVKQNEIYGVSLSLLVKKETAGDFEISEIKGVSDEITEEMKTCTEYRLTGTDSIRIPEMGEKCYFYATGGENPVSLKLQSQQEGCSLTPDGMLTVTDRAKPKVVTLEGRLGEHLILSKDVEILPNHREDISYKKLENVEKISSELSLLDGKNVQQTVRIVLCIVLIAVLAAFLKIKITIYRKEKGKEEED